MKTSSRKFKDSIFEQFGRVGKALASPTRLEILDLLCQGPRTVEVLAKEVNQSIGNTSQHLQSLRNVNLVTAEKRGLYVSYALADNQVCDFYRMLQNLAESHLLEIGHHKQEYLNSHGIEEVANKDLLLKRIKNGEATVLDVRPTEEYNAGHLPGSISIPLPELSERISELPTNREIVAYCRGPYCVLAVKAVELLRQQGYKAQRLEDSPASWRSKGFELSYTNEIA